MLTDTDGLRAQVRRRPPQSAKKVVSEVAIPLLANAPVPITLRADVVHMLTSRCSIAEGIRIVIPSSPSFVSLLNGPTVLASGGRVEQLGLRTVPFPCAASSFRLCADNAKSGTAPPAAGYGARAAQVAWLFVLNGGCTHSASPVPLPSAVPVKAGQLARHLGRRCGRG